MQKYLWKKMYACIYVQIQRTVAQDLSNLLMQCQRLALPHKKYQKPIKISG